MKYYAFVGYPKTTTGQANKKTGFMSCYGDLKVFDTKKERDEFCNEFNHRFNNYPQATNKKDAKSKYFAGMTCKEFEEYIELVNSGYIC